MYWSRESKIYVLVLSIVKLLDNTFLVSYALKTRYNNHNYKGLVIMEYKTNDLNAFYGFNSFGKWKRANISNNGHILRLYNK